MVEVRFVAVQVKRVQSLVRNRIDDYLVEGLANVFVFRWYAVLHPDWLVFRA